MISRSDVQDAAVRIAGSIRTTPVIRADPGVFAPAAEVWLKLEHLQHTGSFKPRGAFNRVLTAAEKGELPDAGVVAASGGNAGLAAAHVAATVGVPAEVFVPATAPAVKVARLHRLGARVVQGGDKYADAYDAAMARADRTGALLCHAYDQPEVCAGQGTLGLEFMEQAGGVDTVLVAVGGGGLMAGVATAVHGRARVVGVEPDSVPTLHRALAAGSPVDVPVSGIAADALGASRLGDIAFDVARRTGVTSLLVTDDDLVRARRTLWERHRLVIEHGAAAAVAALLSGAYRPVEGERVGVVLCGANTDPADLSG